MTRAASVSEVAGWERVTTPDPPGASRPRSATPDPAADLRTAPEPIAREIHAAAGPRRGAWIEHTLMEASAAYERQRYSDALRMVRRVLEETPDLAAARELAGLCLYRQERWAEAARELERFAALSGSVDQNPVLADCHRALRRHDRVAELWKELAESSPSADLVTEGRIVMAGDLADQRRFDDAIRLLERAVRPIKRPQAHHLRLWYALGDLYERAGDVPRARALFERVHRAAPEALDTEQRLAALG